MNYEMIMLNGAMRMKDVAEDCMAEARRLAVASFAAAGNTMSQIERVASVTDFANKCLTFYEIVVAALKGTSRGYRELLIEIYLKKADKAFLCSRYNVRLGRLYRILAKARREYARCLRALDCDKQWFDDNYGDIDWVKQMAAYEPGKGGRLSA